MNNVVPVMFCFNENYVIPAAVTFQSMLETVAPGIVLKLYVVHDDISPESQKRLETVVSCFPSASLTFINPANSIDDLFSETKTRGHYSKEMFFKFLAPDLFQQYDKIVISDVDVAFMADVSRDYHDFDTESEYYLAGSPGLVKRGSWVDKIVARYQQKFSKEEISKLLVCAGYFIFNLKKMRSDGCQQKFLDYAKDNAHRILQPEQDVINVTCHPYIKILPADSIVCSYSYEYYDSKADYACDLRYSSDEVESALKKPVQLHFAGAEKPWSHPSCTMAHVWFQILARTPLLTEYLKVMENRYRLDRAKKIISFKVPFSTKVYSLLKIKRSIQ
jgi:lipopolysaccharide biosynthesis glycosyltransferase